MSVLLGIAAGLVAWLIGFVWWIVGRDEPTAPINLDEHRVTADDGPEDAA